MDNTDLLAASRGGGVRDLTSSAAAESNATWSADGSRVIFTRQSTTGRENGAVALQAGVYVWSRGRRTPRRIASCSEVCSQSDFAWSPDDRQIAFAVGNVWSGDNAIAVMNADGSALHTVCDGERCGWGLAKPMWSPDGHKLVFSNEGALDTELGGSPPGPIWIANADGSGLQRLTQPNCAAGNLQPRGCAFDTSPAWSPNGRLIVFSHSTRHIPSVAARCRHRRCAPALPQMTTSIEVMGADGSHRHRIYDCAEESCSETLPLAWTPDGGAVASGPMTATESSVRVTTLTGKTTTLRTCAGSRCLHAEELVWSPNGKQLALVAGGSPQTSGVWVMGRNGDALHRISAGGQCCLAWVAKVSLDGAKAISQPSAGRSLHLSGSIISGTAVNARRPFNLLSFGAAGTHVAPLAAPRGKEPAFSPDGRTIAYTGTVPRDYAWHILVADRNGQNRRLLTDRWGTGPAWSPDGRTIAFTRDRGGSKQWIGLVSATGGHYRDLTSDGREPAWSPSGNELVFQRHVASGDPLFTVRSDGRRLRRLTNLPGWQGSPAWSPDGKEIAFIWGTPAGVGLYLIRPDGTHLRRVTTAAVPTGKPAWSPDGRYLVVMSDAYKAASTPVVVIDVRSGRVSTVATVPGPATGPSWSSR